MEHTNELYSERMDEPKLRAELGVIINTIKKTGIANVEILFGVGWGNEYKDWISFTVGVDEILLEIEKAEKIKVGFIGRDDLYIMINEIETEILICHECDIHLLFNYPNALVSKIIED